MLPGPARSLGAPARRVIFSLMWLVAHGLIVPGVVAGQVTDYQPVPPISLLDPNGFFSVPPLGCNDGTATLPDGGYMKTSTPGTFANFRIAATASVQGSCDVFSWGTKIATQYRNINAIRFNTYPPQGNPSYHPFWGPYPYPNTHSQTYDTENPGSGGASLYPVRMTQTGEHLFTFQTDIITATGCNFPRFSAIVVKRLFSVTCEPIFGTTPETNAIIRMSPLEPPNKIKVYLPESMSTLIPALEAAINDWNGFLPDTLQFQRVDVDCGDVFYCIRIEPGPETQLPCGRTEVPINEDTGLIFTSPEMRLRSDWPNFTPTGAKRTFVHELGHLLGLDNSNRLECGVSDAAMQDQFDCRAAGIMDDVTVNDFLPVLLRTAYGPYSRVACGF